MTYQASRLFLIAASFGLAASAAQAQTILTNSNGIVRNSLCVGSDCQTGIAFGDSTIVIKENNTRIKFADTSTGSFPSGDWEIEANSSVNGGQSYLGFNDCGTGSNNGSCSTDLVFAVETGARSSALYVESDGDVGFGTSNPVTEIHAVRGDTPTLRLEQDGSSGFSPQTWDMAGNETSFFIRDVTNSSTLPFRIRPGAPSQALVVDTDGDVGIGTLTSDGALHVERTTTNVDLILEQTGGTVPTKWTIRNNASTGRLTYSNGATTPFKFSPDAVENLLRVGISANDEVDINGDLVVSGTVTTGGPTCGSGCDRVFDADYNLLSIEEHANLMFTNRHLPAVGPTGPDIQINLTDKLGNMLNELEHAHIYIVQQQDEIVSLSSDVDTLTARLATLEVQLRD